MSKVTIFMPVSRDSFLDRVFTSLELLECDVRNTNLLVIVDGDAKLFTEVRNIVQNTKFAEKLCVQFKSNHTLRRYSILERRLRISDIHNLAKTYIKDCDYIFGVEDDTIVPTNALSQLLRDYSIRPFAGFIEGIEMGRWGIPYIGAWQLDDIYNPTQIKSTKLLEDVQEIDAGGFYCFLTRSKYYLNHVFKPYGENGSNDLGPDVDYGISLRRMGLLNYANYSIKCIHKKNDGDISFNSTNPSVVTFIKKEGRWRQNNHKT